jgi:hypothetical protein
VSAVPGVDELLALRDLTRSRLEAEPGVTVDRQVAYGSLTGVDRMHAAALSPAHFYFSGDTLELVYVPRPALTGTPAADWLERVGPGPQLRSRTGKRSVLEVRPEIGFAFAHDDGEVELAEVFAPMTLEAYEHGIYEDPGSFVR